VAETVGQVDVQGRMAPPCHPRHLALPREALVRGLRGGRGAWGRGRHGRVETSEGARERDPREECHRPGTGRPCATGQGASPPRSVRGFALGAAAGLIATGLVLALVARTIAKG
jgi:hypothetical protein